MYSEQFTQAKERLDKAKKHSTFNTIIAVAAICFFIARLIIKWQDGTLVYSNDVWFIPVIVFLLLLYIFKETRAFRIY